MFEKVTARGLYELIYKKRTWGIVTIIVGLVTGNVPIIVAGGGLLGVGVYDAKRKNNLTNGQK